ncbi:uncharacterized protein LOC117327850 [Pecten maximus]|uniref:uncharacterized protein LOC117327850 n=1 Tax=Pecten maximus TaxID=6579 RepID=UPI0014586C26|nr:uncharacterized protein LOC117327850 [Pecten maximus]
MYRLLLLICGITAYSDAVDLASPEVFDAQFYLNNYPDIHSSHTPEAAKAHWLSLGIAEGRQGCGSFHSKQYVTRYPDLTNAFHANYNSVIAHYLTNGIHEHRLGYIDGGYDGRWTISNGKDLFISASKRMGGAIDSLVWNNKQMINMYDHGRELQMACNSDTYTECYNPTEAGGRDDSRHETTHTHIQWVRAHGDTLESEVHPAFWLRPGTHEKRAVQSGCHRGSPSLTHQSTYAYPFWKQVRIGVHGMSHAIEFMSNFTLAGDWPHDLRYIQMEAPTGYMPGEFTTAYRFNTKTLSLENHGSSLEPPVVSTDDGQYAMGVYSPPGQDSDVFMYYGVSLRLGGTSFTGSTNKWNVVYRKSRFTSGVHHQVYKTYICVGTLNMVTGCLHTLIQDVPHI